MYREVNLTKRVRTPQGLRYCPVVLSNNGRVKPDCVIVSGREEKHPEGAYYLEWREQGKRRRLSVGVNAQDAAARRLAKEAELNARNHGLTVASTTDAGGRRAVSQAISKYLLEIQLTKKPKTHSAYSTALTYFGESCAKQYLEEIDRHDLLKYVAYLRDQKKQAPRSVWNKFSNVVVFLKAHGIQGLVSKNDRPRFTAEDPEVYEQGELDKLFKACDPEERLWYEFFLMTGMREQEVMYFCWKDVNPTAKTVRVSHKPEFGWTPKAYKNREIPVPDRLMDKLVARKKKAGKCPLVFHTSGCKPVMHYLECLKSVCRRAGLDPDGFWLHKFRATFATRHLWNGVDLRTVQAWMGHTDLESTARYLKEQRGDAVRAKVNSTFG